MATRRTEMMLMGISTGIALAGIGIAVYFWLSAPGAAAGLARQFSGVHRLLLNKYYVDEIYDAVVVQPIKQLSSGALWKGVDAASSTVWSTASASASGLQLRRCAACRPARFAPMRPRSFSAPC